AAEAAEASDADGTTEPPGPARGPGPPSPPAPPRGPGPVSPPRCATSGSGAWPKSPTGPPGPPAEPAAAGRRLTRGSWWLSLTAGPPPWRGRRAHGGSARP